MMQQKLTVCAALFLLMLTTIQAWSAGFSLYENSSRGTGVSGAIVAQADDPSALFYNPSGITQLEGTHFTSGTNTYTGFLELEYPGNGMESVKRKTWIVPNMYISHKLMDQLWIGLGVFAPFGLGNEFREDWYGRYNMYHSEIKCVEFNPNIAYKFSDSLSFALGISSQSFEILAKRKISPKMAVIQGLMTGMNLSPDAANLMYEETFADTVDKMEDIDQEASLDDRKMRFNLSFRYQANDRLSFGGNYRSRVSYSLEGDVKYKCVSGDPTLKIYDTLYDASISADITLPELIIMGIAYKVNDNLTIEADIVRTKWSVYDKLVYNFKNGLGIITEEKDWNSVNCYRFGAEYDFAEVWSARLGYLFDESPLPDHAIDYSLPGNDRHLFSGGIGYKYNKFTIDAHYALVICLDRDIQKNESIFIYDDWSLRNSYTHHLGFNIGYVF